MKIAFTKTKSEELLLPFGSGLRLLQQWHSNRVPRKPRGGTHTFVM